MTSELVKNRRNDNFINGYRKVLNMSRGVLYIGGGRKYIEEATISAQSVKDHMPDVSISIITHLETDKDIFDEVITVENTYDDYGMSLIRPDMMPYERTLYLDTDTYICKSINGAFDILDHVDLAFANAPNDRSVQGVPEPWTEYNTGVIAYKNNAKTKQFFRSWEQLYEKWRDNKGIKANQPSFLKTVHESNVSFFTLSPEYNIRSNQWGAIYGDPKIVHARHGTQELSEVASQLEEITPCTFWPRLTSKHVRVFNQNDRNYSVVRLPWTLKNSLKENGVRGTVKKTVSNLKRVVDVNR